MFKKVKGNKKLTVFIAVIILILIIAAAALLVMGGKKKSAGNMQGGFSGTPGGKAVPGGFSGEPAGMSGSMGGAYAASDVSYAMVKTMHPEKGSVYVTSSLTGSVESSAAVYVYSEASGDVTAVNVKVGDNVKKGDVLCEIDTGTVESAKNSMESAQISMEQAKNNLARMEILYAGGDITEQEHEQYQNSAKTAELQYQTAKANYEKQLKGSSVAAPIDGSVQSCSVEVNEKVGGNQVLFVIVGSGKKRISFYVSERIMQHLSVGDEMCAIKNNKEYPGKISSVNTIVDSSTGLFECTADLDATDEIAIGSTVRIDIISDRSEDVLTVPVDAIYYSGGDAYLYTVVDGKAKIVNIEVGLYDDDTAEIISGVTDADEVISTWSNNLYEGANVRVNDEEFDIDNLEIDDSKKDKGGQGGMPGGGGGMGPM